jgi:hypothetical protein
VTVRATERIQAPRQFNFPEIETNFKLFISSSSRHFIIWIRERGGGCHFVTRAAAAASAAINIEKKLIPKQQIIFIFFLLSGIAFGGPQVLVKIGCKRLIAFEQLG